MAIANNAVIIKRGSIMDVAKGLLGVLNLVFNLFLLGGIIYALLIGITKLKQKF